jgi:hypothetical protein
MDKMSDADMIARYMLQRNKIKERNRLWQETHVGDSKIYYELNKKRLNLRSAELRRQKNNTKKALKLAEAEVEKEKESMPICI